MIMPGVQKPHWRPCWSQNACWSGWSLPPCSMPSIVRDLGAVRLDGEHRARLGAAAVDVDRARAAVAGVAAGVGAGEAERVAQEVDEEEAGLDVGLAGLAVDGDRDVLCRHRLLLCVRAGALGGRAERPQRSARRPSRACSRRDPGRRRPARWRRPRRRPRRGTPRRRLAGRRATCFGARWPRTATPRRPVTPMPARVIAPSASELHDRGDAGGREVADPPLELRVGAAEQPRAGSRTGPRRAPRWARSRS